MSEEFAYNLKAEFLGYRFYWIAKRHKGLIKELGWNRLFIEKKIGFARWKIIRGTGV